MAKSESYPRALPPPAAPLALINDDFVARAVQAARESPRRRVIAPLHKSDADPLHRMLNVGQPGTYVRPHRHLDPPKAEGWVVLRGALLFFTFDDDGAIATCTRIAAGGPVWGADLEPGIFHTFVVLAPDTVIYEVKTGPYAPVNDKAFAAWAPAEGDPQVPAYLASLRRHAEVAGVI